MQSQKVQQLSLATNWGRQEKEENEEQGKRFKIDSNVNYVDSLISYRFFAQSIDFVVVVDYANVAHVVCINIFM